MQTLERPTQESEVDFEEEARLVVLGVWCPKHKKIHRYGKPVQLSKGDSAQFTCELDRVTFKVVAG